METKIPTVEQFRKDVTTIFIDENMDYGYVYNRLLYHLDPTYPDNAKNLTYENCIKKYKTHIDQWNDRNKEREKRGFLAKAEAEKRKTFLEFIEARLYNIDWDSFSDTPIRDSYLFGALVTQETLIKQFKDFRKTWQKNASGEE